MNPNIDFRDIADLKTGDVLLCWCDPSKSVVAKKIHEVTGSEYCHAAIYYGNSQAAEFTAKNGIKKGKIGKVNVSCLVSRYGHIAVFRQPDAWTGNDRISALRLFIDKVVKNQAKYNFDGILKFKDRKEYHEANIYAKLNDFFTEKSAPISTDKHQYFCSEFVCDCFIAVGFIQPGAAVIYQSDTYSPGDLSKDSTFGTFWGYLRNDNNYQVNESDQFYYATTYDVLFEQFQPKKRKKMSVIYTGNKQKIIDAVDYVNDLFEDEKFWLEISEKDMFDNTSHSPSDIAILMKGKTDNVEVKLYRPRWPRHRKTNAYTSISYPNILFLNSKKLWRNIGSMVNTIVHEHVHSVDYTDGEPNIEYGHGSQSSAGKNNAAPYWIGNLAENYFNFDYFEETQIESIEIMPEDILDY